MLRSLPRAASSSSSIRGPSIRSSLRLSKSSTPVCVFDVQQQQRRLAIAHAISNPTLASIEKRWEIMPPQEQAELWMALRDRMKTDWHELTMQEKKAGEQPLKHNVPLNFVTTFLAMRNTYTHWNSYWIAFGPHGPRALPPPGEGKMVFGYTMLGIGISAVIFWLIRLMARPAPSTMNKEYQEATNEYLRSQRVEPITGLSSEGYTGKGQVQSKPKRD
ncbi:Cytochrome c oxidase subunit 5A [Lobaria immixta]|nr:Cytochrome c oxidase subunit 5A [Lobaria immixta]